MRYENKTCELHQSFNWKFLIIAAVFCAAAAVVNNIRVDSSKSVEWIGTQPVMQKPAGDMMKNM